MSDASASPRLWEGPAAGAAADTDAVRRRLLQGLQASIEDRGYRDTTVTDIVRRARASRRTFYQVFATKDDCLVALMEAANQALLRRLRDAVDPTAAWQVQAAQAVAAYVDHVTCQPALTLCWIREFPSLGSVADQVKRASVEAVVTLVRHLSATDRFRAAGLAPVSRELALIILGGLREVTATVVEEGGDVRGVLDVAVAATVAVLGTSRGQQAGDILGGPGVGTPYGLGPVP